MNKQGDINMKKLEWY